MKLYILYEDGTEQTITINCLEYENTYGLAYVEKQDKGVSMLYLKDFKKSMFTLTNKRKVKYFKVT